MTIKLQQTTENIHWDEVNHLLNGFGLTDHTVEETKLTFERSQEVAFLLENSRVIGCGRALTDHIAQASIYNIAIAEEFQSQGWGKLLVNTLVEAVSGCNIVLYTHPNTVEWYQNIGFKKLKTALAIYPPEHFLALQEMGFV